MQKLEKKILITGATGFLGKHLARALVSSGYTVYALSRQKPSALEEDTDIKIIVGDITDPINLPRDIKTIYHCAGVINKPEEMEKVNVLGTQNIVEIALKNNYKLIYLSSAGIIGSAKEIILDENTACHPKNDYEISKYKAEQIVLAGVKKGLRAHILRPVTIFGIKNHPETDNFFHLIKSMRNGYYKNIGHGIYNIVHIDEVIKALEILGETEIPYGESYIIGNTITYKNMDRLIKNIPPVINKKTQTISYPIAIIITTILTVYYYLINKKSPLTFSRLRALTSDKSYSQKKLTENTSFKNSFPVEKYLKMVCESYIKGGLLP